MYLIEIDGRSVSAPTEAEMWEMWLVVLRASGGADDKAIAAYQARLEELRSRPAGGADDLGELLKDLAGAGPATDGP